MPIYAYRCDSCGVRKDVLQKISDAPLTKCTECGATAFHKELSAPAFQLKGTGWYVTDFRDNGKAKEKTGGEKTADAAGAASGSSSGDSAGAAKAEPAAEGKPGKSESGAAASAPAAAASGSSPASSAASPSSAA
jgi:putative FmdB family regulatory protein